jgi:hypothetical protein
MAILLSGKLLIACKTRSLPSKCFLVIEDILQEVAHDTRLYKDAMRQLGLSNEIGLGWTSQTKRAEGIAPPTALSISARDQILNKVEVWKVVKRFHLQCKSIYYKVKDQRVPGLPWLMCVNTKR